MIYPKCGKENPEIARFCSGCGYDLYLAAGSAMPQSKGRFKNKLWLILVIAAAFVLVVLYLSGVFSGGGKTGGAPRADHSSAAFYDLDAEKTYFLVDGVVQDYRLNGSYYTQGSSREGALVLVFNDDSELYLHSLKAKTLTKIADDIQQAQLSKDGNYIVYFDEDEDLYRYDVAKAEKNRIDSDINKGYGNGSISGLSPDGKTILYIAYEKDTYEPAAYVYQGEDKEKIGENCYPLTVSNDGKDIYYYNRDREAYYYTSFNSGEKKKIRASDGLGGLYANSLSTQVIFSVYSDDNQTSYFSEKGGEPVKLSGIKAYVYPVLSGRAYTTGYPTDVLTDNYYRDGDGKKLNDGNKIAWIEGGNTSVELAATGNEYDEGPNGYWWYEVEIPQWYRDTKKQTENFAGKPLVGWVRADVVREK